MSLQTEALGLSRTDVGANVPAMTLCKPGERELGVVIVYKDHKDPSHCCVQGWPVVVAGGNAAMDFLMNGHGLFESGFDSVLVVKTLFHLGSHFTQRYRV